jgi:hypothetical protein
MKKHRKILSIQLIIGLVTGIIILIVLVGYSGYKWHEKPQFCGTCHIMDTYVDSLIGVKNIQTDESALLATAHGTAGIVCLDCHEPTVKQQVNELVVYMKGDFSTPLEKRSFPDEMCLACHDHASREAIAAETTDFTVDFVIEGRFLEKLSLAGYDYEKDGSFNPHLFTLDTSKTTNVHEKGGPLIPCSDCHSMHDESPKIEYCYSCHHSRTFAPCTVCHSN